MTVLRTRGMNVWASKWHEYDQDTELAASVSSAGSNLPASSEEIVMFLATMVGAIHKEEL